MRIRVAQAADAPALTGLIDASIRGLGARFYSPEQISSSLTHLFGVDSVMIGDGTYFAVEDGDNLVGAGGWSFRKTPFGGDAAGYVRDERMRVPGSDAAIIRAMYVHPEHTRKGIGGLVLKASEDAAAAQGFDRFELVSTLSGVAFYRSMGYRGMDAVQVNLPDGTVIDCLRMEKVAP
ncbi:MAG: GNAT superfamily N-acetyltransferase [Rhodothermales bacterium]